MSERARTWIDYGVLVVIDFDPIDWVLRIHRQDGTEQLVTRYDTFEVPDLLPGFQLNFGTLRPPYLR